MKTEELWFIISLLSGGVFLLLFPTLLDERRISLSYAYVLLGIAYIWIITYIIKKNWPRKKREWEE